MRHWHFTASAAIVALALATIVGSPAAVAEEEHVSKANMEKLHHAPLPGVEGKEVIVARFTAPPDFVGGKHYHPGPVYVYVLEGAMTIESQGKAETYEAGEFVAEPINEPMLPKNASGSDELKILVFQVGDIGKPMMVKAE